MNREKAWPTLTEELEDEREEERMAEIIRSSIIKSRSVSYDVNDRKRSRAWLKICAVMQCENLQQMGPADEPCHRLAKAAFEQVRSDYPATLPLAGIYMLADDMIDRGWSPS